MGAPEEISVPQESVVGSVLREILYLLLKIVAIAAAFVVVFTFVFCAMFYLFTSNKKETGVTADAE